MMPAEAIIIASGKREIVVLRMLDISGSLIARAREEIHELIWHQRRTKRFGNLLALRAKCRQPA
jgi:hypothetical protein